MATGRHQRHHAVWRRIALAVLAGALALGIPALALATAAPASASVTTADDYPWRSMPCARSPFTVSGPARYCNNYDWGPIRGGSEASTYSPYGYGYRNCTDFVAWRLDKVNGFKVARTYGDGRSWGVNNSRITNKMPAAGSVAWFQANNHVAWVESVSGTNVIVQEYNHGANGAFDRRAIPISAVTGFIHFRDLGTAAAPAPAPAPAPPPASAASPVFPVMNTSEQPPDGVWFRDNPNASGPRLNGYGVYAGDRVQLQCYGTGTPIGPYANHIWYRAANLTRPNATGRPNVGWLNAHFINDGKNTNVVDPGVPAC